MEHLVDFLHTASIRSPEMIAILIGVGFVVGFVNTIAGLASAVSYALFMAMGMPVSVANGTTRPGVLIQFFVNSLLFKKAGVLPIRTATRIGIPIALGSVVGAQLAAHVNPQIFELAMACSLPILATLLYVDTRAVTGNISDKVSLTPIKFIVFILVGCYGGFTHAGVGLLIIFASVFLLGADLLRANAIKQFAVVVYTPIALTVFIINDKVNWPVALIYAVGNVAGGYLGSKMSINKGSKFIRWSVTLCVVLISFWLIYKQF
ncbi:MAG: sulfite exporter TauE/SafE family protein [Prevotellaceae bacterium]|nr:sulfite exporter TauE/SafE family protein [Prevotellaceae bacterium]